MDRFESYCRHSIIIFVKMQRIFYRSSWKKIVLNWITFHFLDLKTRCGLFQQFGLYVDQLTFMQALNR